MIKPISTCVALHYARAFDVPKLDIDSIEKELLTKQEVMEELDIRETSLNNILRERNLSLYTVENRELFRKSELEEFLHQRKVETPNENN